MGAIRMVDDAQRRARMARRHAIHPGHRVTSALAAARAMTALHATEASTVHLSVHARADDVSPARVNQALQQDRSLITQLAMRRTLFAVPHDLLAATLGSASARVAAEQHRMLVRDIERHGIDDDGEAWVQRAGAAVLAHLGDSGPVQAKELREQVPELAGKLTYAPGKDYGATINIAPRVLTLLGAQGRIARGPNAGHWRNSRPTWTPMSSWLGAVVEPLSASDGYVELVRRWLHTFGPGTTEDIVWWLGSTKTAVRTALTTVEAVPVALERERTGWLLPDDLDPVAPVREWAALLPTLDPTTMGWKERDFYLDPARAPYLFDSTGNGGTTAWWDGRIVGAWVQDVDGAVQVVTAPGVDLSTEARTALDAQAERLTIWLDGTIIANVYKSALMTSTPLP